MPAAKSFYKEAEWGQESKIEMYKRAFELAGTEDEVEWKPPGGYIELEPDEIRRYYYPQKFTHPGPISIAEIIERIALKIAIPQDVIPFITSFFRKQYHVMSSTKELCTRFVPDRTVYGSKGRAVAFVFNKGRFDKDDPDVDTCCWCALDAIQYATDILPGGHRYVICTRHQYVVRPKYLAKIFGMKHPIGRILFY
jgi:hypothetical protein